MPQFCPHRVTLDAADWLRYYHAAIWDLRVLWCGEILHLGWDCTWLGGNCWRWRCWNCVEVPFEGRTRFWEQAATATVLTSLTAVGVVGWQAWALDGACRWQGRSRSWAVVDISPLVRRTCRELSRDFSHVSHVDTEGRRAVATCLSYKRRHFWGEHRLPLGIPASKALTTKYNQEAGRHQNRNLMIVSKFADSNWYQNVVEWSWRYYLPLPHTSWPLVTDCQATNLLIALAS